MKFYSNDDLFIFTSEIKDILYKDKKVYIELENTYFYPESGGQLSDTGTIGNKKVFSVIEDEEGRILHEVIDDTSLFLGMRLKCIVDFEKRMENSRNHTGQHLFSAILENDYNIKTISFSMSENYVTIDTDKVVDIALKKELMEKVNNEILNSIEVTRSYAKSSELEKYGLRKLIKITGDIQLIKIGDIDLQGCCGTHVNNTKELIIFYIKKIENYKGGSRIYFLFGKGAYNYINESIETFEEIKRIFNVHESEVLFQIKLLWEKYEDERKKVIEIRQKLVNELVKSNEYSLDFIYKELDDDEELIKMLVNKLILSGRSGMIIDLREKRLYGFTSRSDVNLGKFFKENKTNKIRGGGGKNNFQGISDELDDLLIFAQNFKDKLKNEVLN